jgi:hypothetical protein
MKMLAPLLGVLFAATLLPQAAHADGLRDELALQWAPAGLSNDSRRTRNLAYDHDMGNGWALGASLGYGDLHRNDKEDGLYGVVRVRYRFPAIAGTPWLRPQLGLEYGGASAIFRTVELWGVYGGVHMAASDQLAFTVDLWAGRSHDDHVDHASAANPSGKQSLQNIRFGLVVSF